MSLQIVIKDRLGTCIETRRESPKEVRETLEMLKPWISARRAIRNLRAGGECFAPLICFAQLRAETSKNDPRGFWETLRIRKIQIFGNP